MPRTARLPERIGAVFLPEADTVEVAEDSIPRLARSPTFKQGCYALSVRPADVRRYSGSYSGTLRVEHVSAGVRFSGDLYHNQPIEDLVAELPDTGEGISIYPRTRYHSYLCGIGVQLSATIPTDAEESLTLEFEEFVYNHPATGFNGTFDQAPTRRILFALAPTASPDHYSGTVHEGTTELGSVSIRWVSPNYRRAHLQVSTLEGAVAPPADVDGTTIATIFTDAGWELSVTQGDLRLPAVLSGVNIHKCWTSFDLTPLMASIPGHNPADLDVEWRLHLLVVPGDSCRHFGRMFDMAFTAPAGVPREGAVTYSHARYLSQASAGLAGSPDYDEAADQPQHEVPRAYLRSAVHELGHALNQLHQIGHKGPADNSIMTPTTTAAELLGAAGTFPDELNLVFNDRVKSHLRHLPDPAVRPGAMEFFGSTIAAPEAAEVTWLEMLELSVEPSSDRVALGAPVTLSWTLTNQGQTAVPAPAELEVESLVARVSITGPTGEIVFLRPVELHSCPQISIVPLKPGASVRGSTSLFWGRDGFAFEMPGRHVIEVIALWDLAGIPVAVSGERDVFVEYPTSKEENEVAALLLDPDVGTAVAFGDVTPFKRAAERIRQADQIAPSHPANEALRRAGLSQPPS
jgi:hypothetical protein